MDYKYIEQLLERYWACETSLQEESILRKFFSQHDVPAHLQAYQTLFQCQDEMADEHLSDDFDKRILALTSEQTSDDVPVVKARTIRFGYGVRPFFKAAAVVAVVLSFSMAVHMAMYPSQESTTNVVTLPPAVVPGAPETAYEGSELQPKVDTLTNTQLSIHNTQLGN